MLATRPARTANHSAYKYVDKREEFQGSNCRGEAYNLGSAPHGHGTWMSEYEEQQYAARRDRITYIVWSFYTPIGYYVEGTGWYLVGQTFSSFTSRHRSGALRNVTGHRTELTGKRGDWIVHCHDCNTSRYFTRLADTHGPLHLH